MLGASLNEIGLVAIFLSLVLLAPKVGKIGEAIGGFFGRSAPPGPADPPRSDPPKSA